MRIAYIGNYTQRHCTEVHLAKTLEKLGHEVVRLQENELSPDWVRNLPVGVDMVLYTRTWGTFVKLEDLAALKDMDIPTVSYHLDLYVGLSRKYLHEDKTLDEILQTDPFWLTDFVFTPDGDPASQEVFERNGVKHFYMRPGVYEDECYMVKPSKIKTLGTNGDPVEFDQYDVLFVGGGDTPGSPHAYGHPEWNYRNELIQWLRDTYGDRFTKFGHPQETIRNEELNQLYADSKVVVGDSVCIDFKHTYYWSDRVCETLGRGGFLIHPYIKGMDEEFIDEKHLVYYEFGDWNGLKAKIDYYVEHDEEREAIRKAGHEFVKANATYTQRLSQMLDTVFAVPVPDFARSALPNLTEFEPLRINLGAGLEPTEGWCNLDWKEGKGINVIHNLFEYSWPFNDNSADEIKAIDVLEHMPVVDGTDSVPIKFVEECHRILKPGGILTIQVPHYQSPNLWIDPTHVRGYDPRSMDYFDPDKDLGKWYGYYSDKKFIVTSEVSRMEDGQPSNVTFRMVKR